MNTNTPNPNRPAIVIPTTFARSFISVAVNPRNGFEEWQHVETRAGRHLSEVSTGSCLTPTAQALLAPIAACTGPITLYSCSPAYTPDATRKLCVFQAKDHSTVLRSVGDTTHVYLIDTEEVPHVVLANSPLHTREGENDAPNYIFDEAIRAMSHANFEQVQRLLVDSTAQDKYRNFASYIQNGLWEYTAWTRWRRTATTYAPTSSVTALSTPASSYRFETPIVPESYLSSTTSLPSKAVNRQYAPLEPCYETLLWCLLAAYFNFTPHTLKR